METGTHQQTTLPSIFGVLAHNLLPPDFKLISIPSSSTISSALEILITHNIYGAPVSAPQPGPSPWIGVIEIIDIISFIIFLFQQTLNPSADPNKIDASQILNHQFTHDQVSFIDAKFKSTTLVDFYAIYPPHSSSWSISETSTLQTVIDALSTRSRVVLISNADGSITGLLSRSSVISYFAKHLEALELASNGKTKKTLGEIPGLVNKTSLITANWADPTERALDGFAKIAQTQISHLAMVSGDELVGNVSVKDIKTILEGGCSVLILPLVGYINKIRQENLKAVHPAIHAVEGDTLEKIITRLAVIKIHRMYVTCSPEEGVGTGRKLIGVVTLGDIIKIFRSQ